MLVPLLLLAAAGHSPSQEPREVVLDLARHAPGFVYRVEIPSIGATCVYFGSYLPAGSYSQRSHAPGKTTGVSTGPSLDRRANYTFGRSGCEAVAEAIDAVFGAPNEEELATLLEAGGLVDRAAAVEGCSSRRQLDQLRRNTRQLAHCTDGLGPRPPRQEDLRRHGSSGEKVQSDRSGMPTGPAAREWSFVLEVTPPPSGPTEPFQELVARLEESPPQTRREAGGALAERIQQIAAAAERRAIDAATKALLPLLERSPRPDVRDVVLEALRTLRPRAKLVAEALLALAAETSAAPEPHRETFDRQRAAALELLADLQPIERETLFAIGQLLDDPAATVRLSCVRALGRLVFEPSICRFLLARATEDADEAVRDEARKMVDQIDATRLASVSVEQTIFAHRVSEMLLRSGFDQLEQEAQQLREERARLSSGASKLWTFYEALNPQSEFVDFERRERHSALLGRWSREHPGSLTPRVPLIAAQAWPAVKALEPVKDGFGRPARPPEPSQEDSQRLEKAWRMGQERWGFRKSRTPGCTLC